MAAFNQDQAGFNRLLAGLELLAQKCPSFLKPYAQRDIETYIRQQQRLYQLFQRLGNPVHRSVLCLRHCAGCTWEEIGGQLHYSVRHVQRLHKQALRELENLPQAEQAPGMFPLAGPTESKVPGWVVSGLFPQLF